MPSLEEEENPELVDFQRRFWWTLPLTIVVAVLAMAGHRLFSGGLPNQSWIELVLGTPVVLWAGWPFFPALGKINCAPKPEYVDLDRDGSVCRVWLQVITETIELSCKHKGEARGEPKGQDDR